MRWKTIIIWTIFYLVSISSGMSSDTCPAKFIGGTISGQGVCRVLPQKNDSDYLMFEISLKSFPGVDLYDSAHMAMYKIYSYDLFTKYKLYHSWAPTVRLGVPPDSMIDRNYHLIYMTKATAYLLIQEDYIITLYYVEKLPDVAISKSLPIWNKPTSATSKYFNVLGKDQSKSKYRSEAPLLKKDFKEYRK